MKMGDIVLVLVVMWCVYMCMLGLDIIFGEIGVYNWFYLL